jgi:hypothetical protein
MNLGQTISIPIIVSNNVGDSQLLQVGVDSTATDGIDAALGEYILPPFPPGAIFDVRLKLPSLSKDYSLKDIRYGTATQFASTIYYEIEYQPGNGDTITLQWNFPKRVTAQLKDKLGGIIINESLNDSGSITISNMAINKLDLVVSYNLTTDINNETDLPTSFILFQNYPNPFNPTTVIRFALPEKMQTRLTIYNSLGEKVCELLNKELDAGYHEVEWNAGINNSGIYFYEVRTKYKVLRNKMLLIK